MKLRRDELRALYAHNAQLAECDDALRVDGRKVDGTRRRKNAMKRAAMFRAMKSAVLIQPDDLIGEAVLFAVPSEKPEGRDDAKVLDQWEHDVALLKAFCAHLQSLKPE